MEKTAFIKIRVSDDEKYEIIRKASNAGVSISELIRRQLLLDPITDAHKAQLAAFRERTHVISRLGSNLNQIAKASNCGVPPSEESLLAIADALRLLS